MNLAEKYRPRHFAGIAGQRAAVEQIQRVLARGWGGRAWWLSGPSGTGKSTMAYLIAQHGADPFYIEELDAQLLTPAKLRDVEDGMHYRAMSGKPGKAYLVNEAHALIPSVVRLLLVVLERLPEHVAVIFTTTATATPSLFGSDEGGPLQSRCTQIDLEASAETQRAMAQRAKRVAQAEGIDGLPDEVYVDALAQCRGNLRMLIQRIESGRFSEDASKRNALKGELANLPTGKTTAKRREAIMAELGGAA
jgi:DNA polymerase-3 subunit gamma/tau